MIEVCLLINIEFNKQVFITPERIKLLRRIYKTGSLNAAAKEVDLSYQSVWTTIDELNRIAPNPLVIKKRGGSGGGGTEISNYGVLILKEYSYIEQKILDFARKLNTEINL